LDSILQLNQANIFQQKHLVLSNVTLHIDKGEFVYLIGKTGSGKSSLLKTLYGDIHLNNGDGTVAGFHLNHLKNKQVPFLRRKLGIVFQDFQLLTDRSVNNNLLFVLRATGWNEKSKVDARIKEVLEKVGLGTKGYKMPHELSGGEQQRVAVARPLLNDPELILADEPTGNLDPETSTDIMKLLFDISKSGCAVLMATHNYEIIKKFPARIIRCEQGRVIELAPNSDFLRMKE
jgi:cell division transport system ATP-binding protein